MSWHLVEKALKSFTSLIDGGSDLHIEAPEKLNALCPKEDLEGGRFNWEEYSVTVKPRNNALLYIIIYIISKL